MSWLEGESLYYLAAMAVVFAAAVSLVLGSRYLVGGRTNATRERLRRFTARTPAGLPPEGEASSLLRATLKPLARLATPTSQEALGRLRATLVQAGFRGERAELIYLTVKVGLALVLGALVVGLNALVHLPLWLAAFATLAAVAAGFYLPSAYVASRVRARQADINHSLPNTLDLLVTCIEAGLGLDEAMNRVAGEIGLQAPVLARELRQAALEMSAGLGRAEAFRRMADRTGVDETRMLAAIIVQTEMFGTSIAKSLRIQAESMRVRRTQLAEERAATVGVKMTVPLIFCIVPALFVVLIGPGIVRILRHLLPILGAR